MRGIVFNYIKGPAEAIVCNDKVDSSPRHCYRQTGFSRFVKGVVILYDVPY